MSTDEQWTSCDVAAAAFALALFAFWMLEFAFAMGVTAP